MAYAERQAAASSGQDVAASTKLPAATPTRFRVLLTNDDGIHALGLAAMAMVLLKEGFDVRVAAPVQEHSACGHSITLCNALRARVAVDGRTLGLQVQDANVLAAAVAGTPADCIKLALCSEMLFVEGRWHPDLVISGINKGANFGQCTIVSGTCAGAREAAWKNVPALAASLDCYETAGANVLYEEAALGFLPVIRTMQTAITNRQWPQQVFLNANYPDTREPCTESGRTDFLGRLHAGGPCRGIRVVSLSDANIEDDYAGTSTVTHTDDLPWSEFKVTGAKINHNTWDGNPSQELALLADGFLTISVVSGYPGGASETSALQILKDSSMPECRFCVEPSAYLPSNVLQCRNLVLCFASITLVAVLLRRQR